MFFSREKTLSMEESILLVVANQRSFPMILWAIKQCPDWINIARRQGKNKTREDSKVKFIEQILENPCNKLNKLLLT